jgi:hypothetical protein
MTTHPPCYTEEPSSAMARLIQSTAERLWDVSMTILTTGYATEGDWELARLAASTLLVALQNPPAPKRPGSRG